MVHLLWKKFIINLNWIILIYKMEFDNSLIKYQKGINFIYVKYNETILIFKVLSIRIPFGIKDYSYKGKTSYHIQISIDKNNIRLNNLLNLIVNLEKDAKEKFNNYSLEDKSLNDKQFVSRIYNGNNDPLIRLEFKENTIFKNNLDEVLPLNNYLNKRIISSVNFSYNGIYIGNKSYGLSLKINEIVMMDEPKKDETIFSF